MAQKSSGEALNMVDALVQLSFLVQGVLARAGTAHDVSVIQIRLFGILRDREPGMLELAKYLHLDKSSVTGLIDRAERRGLVRRTTTPEDGRAVRVSVTKEGRALVDEVTGEIAQEIEALVAGLSDGERGRFVEIAGRVIAGQVDMWAD